MEQRDDLELLSAWRAGEVAAGNELFSRHYRSVHRFFANKINHGVEDLVQSAFTRCIEGLPTIELRGVFRPYLFGICRHVLLDAYRATRRPGAKFDPTRDSIADLGAGPSTIFARQRRDALLLEALRRLPLEQQTLLELFYWENLTGGELAELLSVPENTARSRVRLAREQLLRRWHELARLGEAIAAGDDHDLDRWAIAIREQIDDA